MRVALAGLVLAALARTQSAAGDELVALEPVLRAATDRVAPSLVTVETFGGARAASVKDTQADAPAGRSPPRPTPPNDGRDRPVGPLRPEGFLAAQGTSTGLVIGADGWILISRFALQYDPTTIVVTLADGRSFPAERKGEDKSRGIALVKIEASGLPVPELAPRAEVQVGQWAIALGRTFGRQEPSVHLGIVSATGRIFGRAVQTDAWTSPANYGGPLLDVQGRVLGLIVPLSRSGRDAGAELYDSGIGFAATLEGLEPLLERMRRGERLHRGWLGVSTVVDWLGPGAKLASVVKGKGAHGVGLRKGDVILAVDEVAVRNPFHLQDLIGARMGGESVHLRAVRKDGEEVAVTVVLADLPEEERAPRKPAEEARQLPWEEGEGERKR